MVTRAPPTITLFCDRCNQPATSTTTIPTLCTTCQAATEYADITRQWARPITGAEFRTAAVQAQRRADRRRARQRLKRTQRHAPNAEPAPPRLPLQPSA